MRRKPYTDAKFTVISGPKPREWPHTGEPVGRTLIFLAVLVMVLTVLSKALGWGWEEPYQPPAAPAAPEAPAAPAG